MEPGSPCRRARRGIVPSFDRRAFLQAAASVAGLSACGAVAAAEPAPEPVAKDPAASPDRAFAAFAQRFLDDNLRRSPTWATHAGDHRHDATWPDISPAGEARTRKFYDDTRAELARFPRDQLSEQNRIDASILDDRMRYELFALDELRVVLRPRFADRFRANMANLLAVLPHGRIAAAGPVALGQLRGIFDQPPSADVVPRFAR